MRRKQSEKETQSKKETQVNKQDRNPSIQNLKWITQGVSFGFVACWVFDWDPNESVSSFYFCPVLDFIHFIELLGTVSSFPFSFSQAVASHASHWFSIKQIMGNEKVSMKSQ